MITAFEWSERAELYRPTDEAAIAAEIRQLHQTGLTPRDISSAMRLNLGMVLRALQAAA